MKVLNYGTNGMMTMMNSNDIDLLREEAGHLLVARACDRDDWIGAAVLDIAMNEQRNWGLKEYRKLLADLRRTPGCLADWLDLNT
jgi:hypothetical protein